jgi:hypothetical protein
MTAGAKNPPKTCGTPPEKTAEKKKGGRAALQVVGCFALHRLEDDKLLRNVTVDGLEDEGFEVIEAATGEEALDRCRERIADTLLTDIMLPGKINGWDIAEHCRDAPF